MLTQNKPRVKAPTGKAFYDTYNLIKSHKLNTVCEEAACPNIGECWSKGHATVMILGSVCTRACKFCNVATGKPDQLDPHEPENLARAVSKLTTLRHIVITSVDRDDLDDGGAYHFARCISEIRKVRPDITIEILTPDFLGKSSAPQIIIDSKPDVFNHNIETVPSLYTYIRPKARYFNSLNLLKTIKDNSRHESHVVFTKSSLMVGLGEKENEILQVMDDLRAAGVDIMIIGQYLQPTPKHAKVERYVSDEEFARYQQMAYQKGFLQAKCGPLVRSSYHAEEEFLKLRKIRAEAA